MTGQIAVVTGAAGGFGAAICKDLLAANYLVAATDLNADGLATLASQLNAQGRLHTFEMDVTDLESVKSVSQAINQIADSTVTVLVNNAGIIASAFCLNEDSPLIAQKVFDVNLNGAFNCTTVFSQIMARQRYGRIINIGSIAGISGASGSAAYAASKAGLINASKSWARELGPMNICVTCLAPGICKTDMLEQILDDKQLSSKSEDKVAKSMVPIGRFGTAEDISEVVTFLATCKTNYLNATVIELDGGLSVGSM